jgi:hypothetical protein
MKPLTYFLTVGALLTACAQESGQDRPAAKPAQENPQRPAAIRDARDGAFGGICRLDTVNGWSPQERSFPPGATAIFMGWGRTSDPAQPVPPMVYLVLRPRGGTPEQDLYLEMGRMPRPDLAGDQPSLEMSGFEGLVDRLPAAGVYEVHLSQGTRHWQTLSRCGDLLTVAEPEPPSPVLVPFMEGENP